MPSITPKIDAFDLDVRRSANDWYIQDLVSTNTSTARRFTRFCTSKINNKWGEWREIPFIQGGLMTIDRLQLYHQGAINVGKTIPLTIGPSDKIHLELDQNEIQAKNEANESSILYLNRSGGDIQVGGPIKPIKNYTGDFGRNGLAFNALYIQTVRPHSIEFLTTSNTVNHGGYLDFHYNASTADYTSRIMETENGCLTINNNFKVYKAHQCKSTAVQSGTPPTACLWAW